MAMTTGSSHVDDAASLTKETANSPREKGTVNPSRENCKQLNGLSIIAEPAMFECSKETFAPYTLPLSVLMYKPSPKHVQTTYANSTHERYIHCNIELSEEELELITRLQEEARRKGLEFYPSIAASASRHLWFAKMDFKKALQSMMEAQAFRLSWFAQGPVRDDDGFRKFAQRGIAYLSGRDRAMRPVLVCRCCRIPKEWMKDPVKVRLGLQLIFYCLEYASRYMLVPGRVETFAVIVDAADCGLGHVHLRSILDLDSMLSNLFRGRLARLHFVHLPKALGVTVAAIRKLFSARAKEKIQVARSHADLIEHIDARQLEEDLGGTRPKFENFLPFPLLPGPYDGDEQPTALDQVQNAHELFTPETSLGRLWDPSKGDEDNMKLELSPCAADFFKSQGCPELLQKIGRTTDPSAVGQGPH